MAQVVLIILYIVYALISYLKLIRNGYSDNGAQRCLSNNNGNLINPLLVTISRDCVNAYAQDIDRLKRLLPHLDIRTLVGQDMKTKSDH